MISSRVGNGKSGPVQYGWADSRGRPDECVRIPSTVTLGPSGYACSRSNQGNRSEAASSSRSFPASRCCMTPIEVNSFEIEQIEYMVEGVAATPASGWAYP